MLADEIIICNNCFSAIKNVGQYGRVIPLNSNPNIGIPELHAVIDILCLSLTMISLPACS